MSTKKALFRAMFWIALALCFNIGILIVQGEANALQFLGGYMIELSLSIDNLFLFIMVFTAFGIKSEYQRRVLNYGIFGAMILRLIFVMLGVTIVNMFHWILYIFGAILIFSGLKMMLKKEEHGNLKDSNVLKLLGKIIPVSDQLNGEKFFIREKGKLIATPLFAILILIEFTDILFAIDSIPAIFSITRNTFIVYTSNIFAIMGLRSLFFLLGSLHEKFAYVKYGVALILTFTGVKLLVLFFHIEISIILSLAIIFTILVGSIILSILFTRTKKLA